MGTEEYFWILRNEFCSTNTFFLIPEMMEPPLASTIIIAISTGAMYGNPFIMFYMAMRKIYHYDMLCNHYNIKVFMRQPGIEPDVVMWGLLY